MVKHFSAHLCFWFTDESRKTKVNHENPPPEAFMIVKMMQLFAFDATAASEMPQPMEAEI